MRIGERCRDARKMRLRGTRMIRKIDEDALLARSERGAREMKMYTRTKTKDPARRWRESDGTRETTKMRKMEREGAKTIRRERRK